VLYFGFSPEVDSYVPAFDCLGLGNLPHSDVVKQGGSGYSQLPCNRTRAICLHYHAVYEIALENVKSDYRFKWRINSLPLDFNHSGYVLWTLAANNFELPAARTGRDFVKVLMWAKKHTLADTLPGCVVADATPLTGAFVFPDNRYVIKLRHCGLRKSKYLRLRVSAGGPPFRPVLAKGGVLFDGPIAVMS
jgi:hypothetical protein